MIDWLSIGLNSIWVLGLVVILSAVGYNDWWAVASESSWRNGFRDPMFLACFAIGVCLFCLGMASSANSGWESAAWSVLAILMATQGWRAWRTRGQER